MVANQCDLAAAE